MRLSSSLLFFIFKLVYGKPSLYPGYIFMLPNSAFLQYINHTADEKLHRCFLMYSTPTTNYSLTISMNSPQEFLPEDTFFGKRLSNLERNVCGIRITDHQVDDPTNMILGADYTNATNHQLSFNSSFTVGTYEHSSQINTIKYVVLGKPTVVECVKVNGQMNCALYDPQGRMVQRNVVRCQYKIEHVTMEHIGNWTCNPTFVLSMESLKLFSELREMPEETVDTWYKEEDNYGIIGCRFNIFTTEQIKTPEYCQLVSPQNDVYTISRSVGATARYTSLGTDLAKNTCQIEMKLPLLESEKGKWKCIVNYDTGGFIDVFPPTRASANEDLYYPRHTTVYTTLGSSLKIFCRVPYSSNYCYIKSPSNEYIFGGDIDQLRLGECTKEYTVSNSSHLGTWKCHYSKPDSAEDDIIEVEVKKFYGMNSLVKNIDVGLKQSASIMCKASTPILSCQFLDPMGNSYNVYPEKSTSEIHYVGEGLDFGDCGLKIDSVRSEHSGTWTCIVNNINEPGEVLRDTTKIYVSSLGGMSTSTASAIGIPVGIMAVAVLLLSFAIYRRYRKRSTTTNTNARISNTSNESNTDMPIFNLPTTVYTNNTS